MCGPDIIFKQGGTLWIIQVRCVKKFYRAYRLDSARTVDPNLFYTVRDNTSKRFEQPLCGYEAKRERILALFQSQKLNIRKMVVASSRVRIPSDAPADIQWVTSNTPAGQDFFAKLTGDADSAAYIWRVLDEQCNRSEQFEEPNAADFDVVDDDGLMVTESA